MAVFCSSSISRLRSMLLSYCLSDFQMVPVAPTVTGIALVLHSTCAEFILLLLLLLLLLLFCVFSVTALFFSVCMLCCFCY
jgi:hypothetical protein